MYKNETDNFLATFLKKGSKLVSYKKISKKQGSLHSRETKNINCVYK